MQNSTNGIERGVPARFMQGMSLDELKNRLGATDDLSVEDLVRQETNIQRQKEDQEVIETDSGILEEAEYPSPEFIDEIPYAEETLSDDTQESERKREENTQVDSKILDKIRAQEKEKNRKQTEKLTERYKNEIAELNSRLKELEEKYNEKTIGTKRKIVETAPNTNEKALARKVQELERQVNELATERAMLALENYREALLRENEGQVIPEMITGSTLEELESSVERAREAWTRNVAKYVRQSNTQTKLGGGGPNLTRNAPTIDPSESVKDKQRRYREDPEYRRQVIELAGKQLKEIIK